MNIFDQVSFAGADLRGSAFQAAVFMNCCLKDTRLNWIGFGNSSFWDCKFSGRLADIQFYGRQPMLDEAPAGALVNIDMRGTTLEFVEFRGLDLSAVQLPADDPDLLPLPRYAQLLDHALELLAFRRDAWAAPLRDSLAFERRWATDEVTVGVINLRDTNAKKEDYPAAKAFLESCRDTVLSWPEPRT